MGLAAVRDIRPQLRLESPDEVGAFEQDLLAEFVLARASAGITDTTISADVAAVVGLREWFGRPLWELAARDLDRFFGGDQRALAPGTRVRKAAAFAVFFEFLELRHQLRYTQAGRENTEPAGQHVIQPPAAPEFPASPRQKS